MASMCAQASAEDLASASTRRMLVVGDIESGESLTGIHHLSWLFKYDPLLDPKLGQEMLRLNPRRC